VPGRALGSSCALVWKSSHPHRPPKSHSATVLWLVHRAAAPELPVQERLGEPKCAASCGSATAGSFPPSTTVMLCWRRHSPPPQGNCKAARNLGVAPACQRHSFFPRTAASHSRGPGARLTRKSAAVLPAVASLLYFMSLSSICTISEHSSVCNLPPLPSADCSTRGGHRPPSASAPGLPSRAALCVSWPVSAGFALLQLLIRLGTWALARASCSSWPKYISSHPPKLGPDLRVVVLRHPPHTDNPFPITPSKQSAIRTKRDLEGWLFSFQYHLFVADRPNLPPAARTHCQQGAVGAKG
jgi:hypothetical protein